jgi:hypothetical protein
MRAEENHGEERDYDSTQPRYDEESQLWRVISEVINDDEIEQCLNKLRNLNSNAALSSQFPVHIFKKKTEKGRIRYEVIPRKNGKRKEERQELFKIFPWKIPEGKLTLDERFVLKLTKDMRYFYTEGEGSPYSDDDLHYLRVYYQAIKEEEEEEEQEEGEREGTSGTIIRTNLSCESIEGSDGEGEEEDNDTGNGTEEPPKKRLRTKTPNLQAPFRQIIETCRALKSYRLTRAVPRDGSDRAGWMKIRSEDLPTRHLWCHPGEVFGVYPDGVGYLRQQTKKYKFMSVIVFSTQPDTVEAHPEPQHHDHYVRMSRYVR